MAETVEALLRYAIPPTNGEPAFQPDGFPTPDRKPFPSRNFEYELYEHKIVNVRGRESTMTLDENGMAFLKTETQCRDFDDAGERKEIEEVYYPECEEIIRRLVGGRAKVVVFEHKIRRHNPNASSKANQPVLSVHIDQTTDSAHQLAWKHYPHSLLVQERNMKVAREDRPPWSHVQLINIWRPIRHTAWGRPLALCDYRSVDAQKDLIPTTLGLAGNEMYGVQSNQRHRWYYLRGMEVGECVVFKCFDSTNDKSVAKWSPHTSFKDPTTPKDAPPRESIEVRAMVYFDEGQAESWTDWLQSCLQKIKELVSVQCV